MRLRRQLKKSRAQLEADETETFFSRRNKGENTSEPNESDNEESNNGKINDYSHIHPPRTLQRSKLNQLRTRQMRDMDPKMILNQNNGDHNIVSDLRKGAWVHDVGASSQGNIIFTGESTRTTTEACQPKEAPEPKILPSPGPFLWDEIHPAVQVRLYMTLTQNLQAEGGKYFVTHFQLTEEQAEKLEFHLDAAKAQAEQREQMGQKTRLRQLQGILDRTVGQSNFEETYREDVRAVAAVEIEYESMPESARTKAMEWLTTWGLDDAMAAKVVDFGWDSQSSEDGDEGKQQIETTHDNPTHVDSTSGSSSSSSFVDDDAYMNAPIVIPDDNDYVGDEDDEWNHTQKTNTREARRRGKMPPPSSPSPRTNRLSQIKSTTRDRASGESSDHTNVTDNKTKKSARFFEKRITKTSNHSKLSRQSYDGNDDSTEPPPQMQIFPPTHLNSKPRTYGNIIQTPSLIDHRPQHSLEKVNRSTRKPEDNGPNPGTIKQRRRDWDGSTEREALRKVVKKKSQYMHQDGRGIGTEGQNGLGQRGHSNVGQGQEQEQNDSGKNGRYESHDGQQAATPQPRKGPRYKFVKKARN
ncbi:MAG: hypothetical protein M1834_006006 [Cirrosporium novae-zelandiae]|nr:MAG: hypothetical protein M1834_006006 [Cirrosporium novae-zelandiae]